MLFWFFSALFFVLLYLLFNPLILMAQLKIKYGKAVYINYVPIFGILSNFKRSFEQTGNSLSWINNIVSKHPYVKIIVVNLVEKPILILLDPEYYKPLYLDHHQLIKLDTTGIRDVLLKGGLLFSDGQKWKNQRKILGEHFLYEKLKSRIPMMKSVVEEKTLAKQQLDKCYELACSITGEIVIRTFFGNEANGWQLNGKEAQLEITDILSTFIQLRLGNWFVYLKQKVLGQLSWKYPTKEEVQVNNRIQNLKDDIRNIILKRKEKILSNGFQDGDFLDIYLNIYLNQKESEDQIEVDEIISQFATLFLAGTDTTGALIANSLFYLSENQEYQDCIRKEIERENGNITAENISKFVQLDSLLKEVLRLKPSLIYPITRQAQQDIIVKDLKIKKGQILLIGNNFANINSQNYDNPMQFDPNRWLTQQPIRNDNGFVNVPFAAGGRNCIGQHMALIEAKIIITSILNNYEIQKNSAVKEIQWPGRGVQTYAPQNAVILKRK